jgi:hypothetical protein
MQERTKKLQAEKKKLLLVWGFELGTCMAILFEALWYVFGRN